MKRAILVVATSEQPALMKIKAALVATTIAERAIKERITMPRPET